MTKSVLALAVLLCMPGVVSTQSPAQLEANKKVVMEFYRPGLTPEERYALIHKDYVQHNAAYVKYAKDHNISGNEAFRRIRLAQAQTQAAARGAGAGRASGAFASPQAPAGNTFHVLYAEGDTVVRIAQRWTPDPGAPGSYYETFFWDTFRVRDGKLYEHWDAAVVAPGSTGAVPQGAAAAGSGPPTIPIAWPPSPVVPASGCTATPGEVEANKKVARAFVRSGITPEERIALVDPSYVQHNPVFRRYALQNKMSDYDAFKALVGKGAGRAGGAAPGTQGSPPPSVMADVVVGACDVVTLIHKNFRPAPTAPGSFYEAFAWDTFRVRNGKLVEHWDGATLSAADAGRTGA